VIWLLNGGISELGNKFSVSLRWSAEYLEAVTGRMRRYLGSSSCEDRDSKIFDEAKISSKVRDRPSWTSLVFARTRRTESLRDAQDHTEPSRRCSPLPTVLEEPSPRRTRHCTGLEKMRQKGQSRNADEFSHLPVKKRRHATTACPVLSCRVA
jgi:hypothetical protein